MGKTRVAVKTGLELLKESEKISEALKRAGRIKTKKKIKEARIYITSTYNNTIMTLTDLQGNTLAWASAGSLGFKGTKKGTPYAASKVAEFIAEFSKHANIEKFEVYVKGVGPGRDSALRVLAAKGLDIYLIKDVTPIPHNGPTPPKERRV